MLRKSVNTTERMLHSEHDMEGSTRDLRRLHYTNSWELPILDQQSPKSPAVSLPHIQVQVFNVK